MSDRWPRPGSGDHRGVERLNELRSSDAILGQAHVWGLVDLRRTGYNRGMSAPAERIDPHTAVKRELLVRYLDVWAPKAVRSRKPVTYVESARGGAARAALRVFAEFADQLAGHRLEVVLVGDHLAVDVSDTPPGLTVRAVAAAADVSVAGPALAHLDLIADDAMAERAAWRLIGSLGRTGEVLLTLPSAPADVIAIQRDRLREAGLVWVVQVELVDRDGRAELLVFATATEKHLMAFKDELWAVDEFAGIRFRDPGDPGRALVDISLTPPVLPLRRALLAELGRRGRCTVADLQRHTVAQTIYRAADAMRVLQAAVTAGAVLRQPQRGRLSPATEVRAA